MTGLLEAWEAVGRYRDVAEATERIAALVAERVEADSLVLRRVDVRGMRIETVAAGACRGSSLAGRPRSDLGPGQLEAVLAWCRGVTMLSAHAEKPEPLVNLLAPAVTWREVLLAPIHHGEGVAGVVCLLYARGPAPAADAAVLRQLREPLAVALANDARQHEVAQMREALEADRRALLDRLDRQEVMDVVVGGEGGLRAVLEQVAQVAPTDVPVLLMGETGTGKEVIARAIHAGSRRAAGPVVRVNCGAIPAGLLDSELFGHERGSFTGALAARQGRFERADGGTVFLDEIGELSLEAQVRLLRILQDGTFERVGGSRMLHADVRVVAATHRDLEGMVARGEFREDLWYRLSVFPIRLPPLRDRLGDIPAMANHFASRAGKRLGGTPLVPTPQDVDLLIRYPWPGNVRELAAVIERAAILGGGHRLEVAAALGSVIPLASPPPHSPPVLPATAPPADSLGSLDDAMRRHIERALAATGGLVEGRRGAAALLGINPHTLRSRMRKLGIHWRRFRDQA